MPTFTNFYEKIEEANMRLAHTLILYDGEPYYVFCVADHKTDGIFRIYMEPMIPIPAINGFCAYEHNHVVVPCEPYEGYKEMGKKMDDYLKNNEGKTKIIRKMMNSPLFNKFRPFPLGMVNRNDTLNVSYAERSPTRHTQQGLTDTMICSSSLPVLDPSQDGGHRPKSRHSVPAANVSSPWLRQTILGEYPAAGQALISIRTGGWSACAFNRKFAFNRGPAGTVFLMYKTDTVGVLLSEDLQKIRLSKGFKFLKEMVEELNIFSSVEVEG